MLFSVCQLIPAKYFFILFVDKLSLKCYPLVKEVFNTDLSTLGGRIWALREQNGLSRRAFAERLGVQQDEIANIEYNRLKKPEQKESLYRSIATEFGVSLDWIKNGGDNMYGADPRDEIAAAFGELAARHDPVIDGFIQFLRSRTPDQLALIAQQLRECVAGLEAAQNTQTTPAG